MIKVFKRSIILLSIISFLFSSSVPTIITFQGRLSDSGTPVTATTNMRFEIVDNLGTAFWQSHASNSVAVYVNKGAYVIKLGDTSIANMNALDISDIDKNVTMNLRVYVEGTQLTPDILFSATPYSLIAKQAETITKNAEAGNSVVAALGKATDSVGIGTSSPATASILQLDSTSKAFVPPRMTKTQMNAISDPATGSMVYNTTDEQIFWYSGSNWISIQGTSANASYDTGWVACSDWTDQHLGSTLGGNVTHNLNANLSDLIVKVLVSTDGTDANSFETLMINDANTADTGISVYQSGLDSILVQTGTGGVRYTNSSGGNQSIYSQSYYYKVIVYKPNQIIKGADGSDYVAKDGDTMTGKLTIQNELEIDTTSGAFIPPRMTNSEMTAISDPATGSIVFDTDTNGLAWYNGSGWFPFSIQGEPIGAVTSYFGLSAPSGWLICNGSSLGNTGSGATYTGADYKSLYTLIWTLVKNSNIDSSYASGPLGSTADGDWTGASIKVYLPDLRGVFVRGAGTSAKLSNANGIYFSGTLGAYQNDKMQGHRHTLDVGSFQDHSTGSNIFKLTTSYASPQYSMNAYNTITDDTNGTPRTGAETNPANVAMSYIIKYKNVSAAAYDGGSSGSVDLSNYVQKSGSEMTGDLTIDTNVLRVNTSTDRVGIGTASPANKLEVAGTINATAGKVAEGGNPLVPAGCVQMYAGSTVPGGWLICNGAAVSRTTYASLYVAIGTTYGTGDGSTTFNLPDFRGIFPRGAGTSGKLTNANGTAFSGTLGAYQNDKMQGHRHAMEWTTITGTPNNYPYFSDNDYGPNKNNGTYYGPGSPATDTVNGTPRTGTETNPANLAVNFIIKY